MEKMLTPTPKNKVSDNLNPQALQIVENVLCQCKNEKNQHFITGTFHNFRERTSLYTGVPKSVLVELNDDNDELIMSKQINLTLHLSIRKILKKFYINEEKPTCKDIYSMLKAQEIDFPNVIEFNNLLSQLGYESVKTLNDGRLIMENPKHTFERHRYIKKVRIAREMKTPIYYLGIRMYDENKHIMVPITKDLIKQALSKPDTLIFYHLISKNGYENGIFTNNADAETFTKWLIQMIVPKFKQSSLVVVDNNTLCCKLEKQYITRYHPKKDMLKWLKKHDLPSTPSLAKAELYELIEKCSMKLESDQLYNIVNSFGHSIVHLPEQVFDLTPIDLLWQDVNENLQLISSQDIKHHITKVISSINTEVWEKYDQIIKDAEESFFTLDAQIEQYLEKYTLDLDCIVSDSDKKWHQITLL